MARTTAKTEKIQQQQQLRRRQRLQRRRRQYMLIQQGTVSYDAYGVLFIRLQSSAFFGINEARNGTNKNNTNPKKDKRHRE